MLVSIIVAIAQNHVIGKDNQLIWHLPNDLKFFKATTTGHPIIMGRKTFESIGRPLPNRTNIVISRNTNLKIEGCFCVTSIQEAIDVARQMNAEKCFVIGGAEIYQQVIFMVDKIYLTEVKAIVEGNVFFEFDHSYFTETHRFNHLKDDKHAYDYSFVVLEKQTT